MNKTPVSPITWRTWLSIAFKWLGSTFLTGSGAAVLAAGQDAVSIVFIVIALAAGIFGLVIHTFIIAWRSSNRRFQWLTLFLNLALLLSFSSCVLRKEQCDYTRQARQKIVGYLERTHKNPAWLGKPAITQNGCVWSFLYEGGGEKIEFRYSHGKIQWWNFNRQ